MRREAGKVTSKKAFRKNQFHANKFELIPRVYLVSVESLVALAGFETGVSGGVAIKAQNSFVLKRLALDAKA